MVIVVLRYEIPRLSVVEHQLRLRRGSRACNVSAATLPALEPNEVEVEVEFEVEVEVETACQPFSLDYHLISRR